MNQSKLNLLTKQEEINKLTIEINKHSTLYHTFDSPQISDEEYDKLYHQLIKLEQEYPELVSPNSPSLKVGGIILDCFQKVEHNVPMLSLNNVFSEFNEDGNLISHNELDSFVKKTINGLDNKLSEDVIEWHCSPKYDGLAISLHYKDKMLVSAVTRGDGYVGEDVTSNVKTIKNIPLYLPENSPLVDCEIRGEILIMKKDFEEINNKLSKLNQKLYSNPRNLAAGTIRQLNSSEAAQRPLTFFAYSLISSNVSNFKTFNEQLVKLQQAGFSISNLCELKKGTHGLKAFFKTVKESRNLINFGIDGVVYKLNNIEQQEQLGYVSRAPKFAIAHKFPAEEVESEILNIDIQVGRTGALTPVAKIKPVSVGGVIVSNATLHNQDEILRKDIRIGDIVIVRRAGDVIPEIARSLKERRIKNLSPFVFPVSCPVCGGDVAKDNDKDAVVRCTNNLDCIAQLTQGIIHFASKSGLNIESLGDKNIESLVQLGLVKNIKDIFKLTKEDLLKLDGFKEKLSQKIIDSINTAKSNVSLSKFIFALGIRQVGESTSKSLAKHFNSINELKNVSIEKLLLIDDIGEISANSIASYFGNQHHLELIDELISQYDLNITNQQKNSNSIEIEGIKNKTIVITGTLSLFGRDELKLILENGGAKVSNSVSKKTDMLICGTDAGSKLQKANELGIQIVDENELKSILNSI